MDNIEQEILSNRSPHWMRCFTVQGKDKQCIAQGAVFRDGTTIVREINGKISIYPNTEGYENSLLDQGCCVQVRDIDDWVDIKATNPLNNKDTLELLHRLLKGAFFSY